MITLAEPRLLALGIAVVALGAARWGWSRAIRSRRAAVGAGLPTATAGVARGRVALRAALLWSGLALAVVALAGPRWGAAEETRKDVGCDLLVAVDCSRSMLAADLYPDRMRVARRKAIDLLKLAPETRMALMPFAGAAVLRCPLTGDHQALAQMLEDCSPDLFPAEAGYQGTAIGDAVRQGLQVLDRQVERGQAILVISDGADPDKDAVHEAAKRALEQGVPVYGLFLGDPERTVAMDVDGEQREMKPERETLDGLSNATGAICVNATSDDQDVRALHEHLRATVAQTPWQERRRITASERFQWPTLAALALVCGGMLLPTRRRRAIVALAAPRAEAA